MLDRTPLPLTTALTFTPTSDGAEVRWESDVLGVRVSRFTTPYGDTELPLVVRALDAIQYPPSLAASQAGFDATELALLTALGLWADDTGSVPADAPRRVGRALYNALTADIVGGAALGLSRDFANASGRVLSLVLRFPPEAVELAALPWELLWDAGATPLLLSRGRVAACTRHLDLPQPLPMPPAHSGPLRVLAIAPRAGIPAAVRLAERMARRATWGPLIAQGKAVMHEVSPATREALVETLHAGPPPDVVHYYGHGRYSGGVGALLLDGGAGGTWTRVETLAALLGGVRLVVLHACQGGMVTARAAGTTSLAAQFLSGVAPALSAAGVPVVIAMQFTVRSGAATRASAVIYRALVAGRSVQQAVSMARQALFVEESDQVSWFVPVLYIRSRETGPVYLVEAAAPLVPAPTMAEALAVGASPGSRQVIVARGGSVRGVRMRGAPGSAQAVGAAAGGSVERAALWAARASNQAVAAEGGEVRDVDLSDDNRSI